MKQRSSEGQQWGRGPIVTPRSSSAGLVDQAQRDGDGTSPTTTRRHMTHNPSFPSERPCRPLCLYRLALESCADAGAPCAWPNDTRGGPGGRARTCRSGAGGQGWAVLSPGCATLPPRPPAPRRKTKFLRSSPVPNLRKNGVLRSSRPRCLVGAFAVPSRFPLPRWRRGRRPPSAPRSPRPLAGGLRGAGRGEGAFGLSHQSARTLFSLPPLSHPRWTQGGMDGKGKLSRYHRALDSP